MHCQVCNAYSDQDISEYNEATGKMDFICGKCNDSHHESQADYQDMDDAVQQDLFDLLDSLDWENE